LSLPRPLRLIFAGTPDFAAVHLRALIADQRQPIAVFTQPDRPAGRGKKLTASPVKQLALEQGLPLFQPASLKDTEAQAVLAELKPDLMVVVAYGLLLPAAVLDIPRLGCINVHASLLPRWRGAAPIQRAIEAGDTESGVTIMQMDKGLDTGAILYRVTCPIEPDETGGSLHRKLAELGPPALLSSLDLLAAGKLEPQPQDNHLCTYAGKISKTEAAVEWYQPADVVARKIRAFNPFPVAFALLNGVTVRLWQASAVDDKAGEGSTVAGEIINVGDAGLVIACGKGAILVSEIQLPGKKRLPVAEVLRGHPDLLSVGARFDP